MVRSKVESEMPKRQNDQLVYITGSGRSGSTLLDMLLARHSNIAALGEVHRVYLNANKMTPGHRCTCGASVPDCPFWRRVNQEVVDLTKGRYDLPSLVTTDPGYLSLPDDSDGQNIFEPVPKQLYKLKLTQALCLLGSSVALRVSARCFSDVRKNVGIADNSHLLYKAVRRSTGKSVVVDSTKTPGRLKLLYLTAPLPFKVLYLLRDGRAVTAARMRRQKIAMPQAAQIWKAEHQKIRAVLATLPRGLVLRMHYEELCKAPADTISRVCDFLGVNFEEAMLQVNKEQSHSLGGNPMRWRRGESTISLDEKWRRHLDDNDMKVFDEIAGPLNRSFGYHS